MTTTTKARQRIPKIYRMTAVKKKNIMPTTVRKWRQTMQMITVQQGWADVQIFTLEEEDYHVR